MNEAAGGGAAGRAVFCWLRWLRWLVGQVIQFTAIEKLKQLFPATATTINWNHRIRVPSSPPRP